MKNPASVTSATSNTPNEAVFRDVPALEVLPVVKSSGTGTSPQKYTKKSSRNTFIDDHGAITDPYRNFIAVSRYARWDDNVGRRETWEETVNRYATYVDQYLAKEYPDAKINIPEIATAIMNHKVMPSMRALMTAGPALSRCSVASYNCAFMGVDSPRAFDEAMYILMCGTGVGFSVETKYVDKLPHVEEHFEKSPTTIVVADSKAGWARGFRELLALLWQGQIPEWDLSRIRPAGTKLKTFGGRASGPEPLHSLFRFCVETFQRAAGRNLKPVECHDIMCKVGEVVVSGGVRRCYPDDAQVLTPAGLVPMADVRVGDDIISGGRIAPVVAKVDSGVQPVIQVHHQYGTSRMTPNHRVAVFDTPTSYTFVEAGSLRVGDRVVWDLHGSPGEPQPLPLPVPAVDSAELGNEQHDLFNTPDMLTEDVAWLVGVLHIAAASTPTTLRITLPTSKWDVTERVLDVLRSRFGVVGNIVAPASVGLPERTRTIVVPSQGFARWMRAHVKVPTAPPSIPSFITRSAQPTRAAYLAGVYDGNASGTIPSTEGVTHLSTIYASFAEEVKNLFSTLGIASVVHHTSTTSTQKVAGSSSYGVYHVVVDTATCVSMYTSLVGPHSTVLPTNVCGSRSDEAERHGFSTPGECYPGGVHTSTDFTYPPEWHTMVGLKNPQRSDLSRTGFLPEGFPYAPSAVIAVTKNDTVQTWDIEVGTIHEFTADGLITHNSAMISLSNLEDYDMAKAKSGSWWDTNGQRALANNSAVYERKPSVGEFLKEWHHLYDSKSGERGIFSLENARRTANRTGRRDGSQVAGVNPCGEILLRNKGFCNLSEVVVDSSDTLETLKDKVRIATIIGTIQCTFTDFRYIRKIWKTNAEEERLLGVSLTGQFGHKVLSGSEGEEELKTWLTTLKKTAIDTNKRYAKMLGIPQSAAITTVKPSGCQVPDTLLITEEGFTELGELGAVTGPDWQHLDTVVATGTGNEKADKFKANGYAPVVVLTLESGMTLTATGNHKYRTWSPDGTYQWCDMDHMSVGTVIPYTLGGYSNASHYRFPSTTGTPSPLKRDLTHMTPTLAWVLGAFSARGTVVNDDTVEIACETFGHDIASHAKRLSTTLGASLTTEQRGSVYSITLSSPNLARWLTTTGCITAPDDGGIPYAIRHSSINDIHAYLDGYSTTRGVPKSVGGTRTYLMDNPRLAQQFITVLRGIGFDASAGTLPTEGNTAATFVVKEHRRYISTEHDTRIDAITAEMRDAQHPALFPDTVVSITTDTAPTVDISVPQGNAYLANSYVSHNTVSQLTNVSSGMHPWHSAQYVRSVRGDNKDPLTQFLKDVNIPHEPDVMKALDTTVFYFPIKAPEGAITRDHLTAIDHLNMWKIYKNYWTEHNPSITVTVKEHEWVDVAAWVYSNWEDVGGISFLPHTDHSYQQAPYQEVSVEEFQQWLKRMPDTIPWNELSFYEMEDRTTGSQELACSAGACEIVDLTSPITEIVTSFHPNREEE